MARRPGKGCGSQYCLVERWRGAQGEEPGGAPGCFAVLPNDGVKMQLT